MKVVAYSIKEFEKEQLALANAKVHDLTLISNELNDKTLRFAEGKEVIIVSDRDVVHENLLDALHKIGIRKIITRSISLDHIDTIYAGQLGIHVANTPSEDQSVQGIAAQTIRSLNSWGKGECLGLACQCEMDCDKKSVK